MNFYRLVTTMGDCNSKAFEGVRDRYLAHLPILSRLPLHTICGTALFIPLFSLLLLHFLTWLPEWQQRIWSGYNISPDGRVSAELLASQVDAVPADTIAPEEFIPEAIKKINVASLQRFSFPIFQEHEKLPEIMERTHRFRATDQSNLFALAKDLARLTADSINVSEIHKHLSLSKGDRPGSLKSLERLLATKIPPQEAYKIMSPLFGIYDLRLGDAHLPSSDIEQTFARVSVDRSRATVIQGFQLLNSCALALSDIWMALSPEELNTT